MPGPPGQVQPNQNFLNRPQGPIPVSHGNVQQQVLWLILWCLSLCTPPFLPLPSPLTLSSCLHLLFLLSRNDCMSRNDFHLLPFCTSSSSSSLSPLFSLWWWACPLLVRSLWWRNSRDRPTWWDSHTYTQKLSPKIHFKNALNFTRHKLSLCSFWHLPGWWAALLYSACFGYSLTLSRWVITATNIASPACSGFSELHCFIRPVSF